MGLPLVAAGQLAFSFYNVVLELLAPAKIQTTIPMLEASSSPWSDRSRGSRLLTTASALHPPVSRSDRCRALPDYLPRLRGLPQAQPDSAPLPWPARGARPAAPARHHRLPRRQLCRLPQLGLFDLVRGPVARDCPPASDKTDSAADAVSPQVGLDDALLPDALSHRLHGPPLPRRALHPA
jgi:hypothetical protein